ncbi:MAG: bifunctional acetaldehyde-CoA/alcohol dehydrogenase [Planctomycetaceae bacterium]|jgi:acetaldehyde dehydrogenase/alcohol dehydrogenase|nr:bifunctional acetaldehyde-CoA/alcohol dehydrogenase [Planctomycetaceae bacterium]
MMMCAERETTEQEVNPVGEKSEKKESLRPYVNTLETLNEMMERVKTAQKIYSTYSQEQVDEIFRAAALAAASKRIPLAKAAVEETGMGIVEDKVIKNHFASEYIFNKFRDEKTCGLIEHDIEFGVRKIAEPVGIVAGVIPTTNPTSTAIFKALLALKTRNGIVFSPHPRAKKCTVMAAKVILEAAVAAGAPEGIIGWVDEPSVELSRQLMSHKYISMILATGGPGMVTAAYSSGKPAIGVGAGNTPAVIDETADIKTAVNSILLSKTFDNGVICASEQSVVVVNAVYAEVRQEFLLRGAHIVNDEERELLRELLLKEGKINADIVGQSAYKIAKMAGFEVPEATKILIGEVEKIGQEEPISYEKLSPVLAMYSAENFDGAVQKASALIRFAGMGHTSVLYTNPGNADRIEMFGKKVTTGRVLINQPSSQGAIGDLYNFRLEPSLTLGCGSWGGNSVSENVGVKHLINVKTITERRENMLWFRVPPKIFFKSDCLPLALEELRGRKRAFIVTDGPLLNLGIPDKVAGTLENIAIESEIFFEVLPDPDLTTIRKGVERMKAFQPDVIIAVGGGSPMDAAKIMWLLYEYPHVRFQDLALRFMDIEKRVFKFPKLGQKTLFVAIPTTSGTGSEVTPFAVVTDDGTGQKYPIADYELTPNIAIVDPALVMTMPKKLTAYSGVDALVHALEAIVSVAATDYSNALALESARILLKYLPSAYENGMNDAKAREKVHNAATMAGMSFANAFLGLCHSMAHKLGAEYHLPHGLANALLMEQVIRFNATEAPRKQAAFPQYGYPDATSRYARMARYIGLSAEQGDASNEVMTERLIQAFRNLSDRLEIPRSIKEAGVDEKKFFAQLDELAEEAFDDQCTGTNPRYPLIGEIKQLYTNAYYGTHKPV